MLYILYFTLYPVHYYEYSMLCRGHAAGADPSPDRHEALPPAGALKSRAGRPATLVVW